MRITSGKFRGLKLKSPKGPGIRPMMDRVRKSLFDALGPEVVEARVLDLFCGTGALGLEALSRGAKEVVFVDQSAKALALVKANLARARLSEGYILLRLSLPRGLAKVFPYGPFGIIFLTPPYGRGLAEKLLPLLPDLLVPGGLLVVEERVGLVLPQVPRLELTNQKKIGQTELFFWRREDE